MLSSPSFYECIIRALRFYSDSVYFILVLLHRCADNAGVIVNPKGEMKGEYRFISQVLQSGMRVPFGPFNMVVC